MMTKIVLGAFIVIGVFRGFVLTTVEPVHYEAAE